MARCLLPSASEFHVSQGLAGTEPPDQELRATIKRTRALKPNFFPGSLLTRFSSLKIPEIAHKKEREKRRIVMLACNLHRHRRTLSPRKIRRFPIGSGSSHILPSLSLINDLSFIPIIEANFADAPMRAR